MIDLRLRHALALLFFGLLPATGTVGAPPVVRGFGWVGADGEGQHGAARVAAQSVVRGSVFVDVDGDGRRGASERGVPQVAVSNQFDVTQSGADGSFTIPMSTSGLVFVSVPDGYIATHGFWRRADSTAINFPLRRRSQQRQFTFAHASDTHAAPPVMPRLARLRRVVDSLRPDFLLITGDLVRDALRVPETEARGYYELFGQAIAGIRSPVYTVPGNHEIFGIERERSGVSLTHPLYGRAMYRHYRGPDYYSFTYGGVHFVGLNTIDADDQWYHGQVDSAQLAWLEKDLALIPPGMPVVTFNHIPLLTAVEGMHGYVDRPPAPSLITVRGVTKYRHIVSNAREVFARIGAERYPLALGGHLHVQEQITYAGLRTRFHLAPAVVSASDGLGQPLPSGVMLYRVRNGVIDNGRFIPLGATAPQEP